MHGYVIITCTRANKIAQLNAISKTNFNYNTYRAIVEDAIPPWEDWDSGGLCRRSRVGGCR